MKKWIKLWISVLVVTALSALTVSAKDAGGAGLQTVEGSSDLLVSLDLPGITGNITSLRFQMYVSLEEGEMSAPKFAFSSLFQPDRMSVYDAEVTWDEDGRDYIVDIVLAGKDGQRIFLLDGEMNGNVTVGTLDLPENEEYYAEVGFVVTDDAEDSVPELRYMNAGGAEETTILLTNAQTVLVGQKKKEETEETQPPVPEESEPTPGVPGQPEEEPLPTTPIPSGPISGGDGDTQEELQPEADTGQEPQTDAGTQPTPQPETQDGTQPTPESATQPEAQDGVQPTSQPEAQTGTQSAAQPAAQPETQTESKPELQPAEPKKNGLAAPELTISPVVGTAKLQFSWKRVKRALGYQLFRYDEESGTYKRYKNVKATSFTGNFSYGETFRFKLRACRKVNGRLVYGAFSAEKEVTASAFNKTKRMRFHVNTSEEDRHFHMSWKEVPGADGYQLLRYDAKTKRFKIVRTIKGGDTLELETSKYQYGTVYRFRMRAFAYDEDGNMVFGAASARKKIKTRQAPGREDESETALPEE